MSAQNFILKKYLRYVYKPRFNAKLKLEEARQEQVPVQARLPFKPCDSRFQRHAASNSWIRCPPAMGPVESGKFPVARVV